MPQMMPLNWITLVIFFTSTFIVINTNLFFNFFPTQSKLSKNNYIKKSNWKW